MARDVDNQTNPKSNFTQLVLQDRTLKLIFMFVLDFFNLSHDFLFPSCGIWILKLVGRLVSTSTQQDNFLKSSV